MRHDHLQFLEAGILDNILMFRTDAHQRAAF